VKALPGLVTEIVQSLQPQRIAQNHKLFRYRAAALTDEAADHALRRDHSGRRARPRGTDPCRGFQTAGHPTRLVGEATPFPCNRPADKLARSAREPAHAPSQALDTGTAELVWAALMVDELARAAARPRMR
jgi:hypothetical protein